MPEQKNSIDERAVDEREKLTKLLFDFAVSEKRMLALEPIIENVAWMKVQLDDTRAAIKNSKVVIAYDNGGGQKGLRENPIFKGYESLWKSYMTGMSKILEVLPEEAEKAVIEDEARPKTVLELVRERHRTA